MLGRLYAPEGWHEKCQVPLFVTPFLHFGDPTDPDDRTRRSYTRRGLVNLLRSADRLFVQTELERDSLMKCGIAEEKLVLQGLGVDLADCTGGNRERTRDNWGVRAGELVVGHLANQSFEKGTVDLLTAAGELWNGDCPLHLILAGPQMPNFERFWQSFAKRWRGNARFRVTQLGVLSDSGKRDFFAGIDVFALPSRCDSFGLVLLEAWANGVPNIAYRAGGPAEIIHHEEDGLLVPCGDTGELASAIHQFIDNEPTRRLFGRAGLARCEPEFAWEDKLRLVENSLQRNKAGAPCSCWLRNGCRQSPQVSLKPAQTLFDDDTGFVEADPVMIHIW